MNISQLHTTEKEVSAVSLFKSEQGNATSIRLLKGALLKEHVTQVPALLICVQGEVVFENEEGLKTTLLPGDYVLIKPEVKHWVNGTRESQLVLMK